MPVSYKSRMTQTKKYAARKAVRRARAGVGASLNRFIGGNRTRGMLPAVMRARGGGTGTELKSVDCGFGTYSGSANPVLGSIPFLTAGTCTYLMAMPTEGASFYNRIARRTRGVSLQIMGKIEPSGGNAAAVKEQYARYLIIYDRQPNGAVPAVSAVLLQYQQAGTGGVAAATSPINADNRDRFMIIRDRKVLLPAIGVNGATPASTATQGLNMDMRDSSFNLSEYIKLGGLETQYKASSDGTIGDIATGSFLILCISDGDANATAAWQATGSVRYSFFD